MHCINRNFVLLMVPSETINYVSYNNNDNNNLFAHSIQRQVMAYVNALIYCLVLKREASAKG